MATLFYVMKRGERRGENGRKNEHKTTQKSKPKLKAKGKIMENFEQKKKKERNDMEMGKEKNCLKINKKAE